MIHVSREGFLLEAHHGMLGDDPNWDDMFTKYHPNFDEFCSLNYYYENEQ